MTLTNWVRLNNAPLLLPRASAVQWNDHVFVLASDGTALLYYPKQHGIWSTLISCKEPLPEGPPPLVLYKGEVLTASIKGMVLRYCQIASQWKECPELKVNGASFYTNSIAMMSDRSNLYAIVYNGPHEKSGRATSCCHVFSNSSGHRWELIGDTGESSCNARLESAALAGSALYIKLGGKMYKLPIEGAELVSEQSPAKQEFVQMKTRNMHLLKGSTLHAIKNELFAFGGLDEDNQPTSDVLRYNPDTDTWESAGYMRSARYNVAVATVQQDNTTEVYVLGGEFGNNKLKTKPKLGTGTESTAADQTPANWDCSTNIVEKCILSD